MEDKKVSKSKLQNILIENRNKLSISGVLDVESFNDEYILLETELGFLEVRGTNLKICKLNIDSSELFVDGSILSCEYTDEDASGAKPGFWARLLK